MRDITRIVIIPTSHLDLFWLGDYRNCLARGDQLIRRYLDRAGETTDETFVIDTAIFAEHFVRTHPHYLPLMRRLIAQDRLKIGAAYIDRWENLVLGESIIRNIQIGRRWIEKQFDVVPRLAAHPDLPGLNAQTSQMYAQAGIDYYVTSRKIFHEGRVWRHIAPDGTALHMLHWPVHYVFIPFREGGLDGNEDTFIGDQFFSQEGLGERYPHGVAAISGSAGDLTAPEDFIRRYGKDQRAYVEKFQREFPDVEITYGVPGTVMRDYLEHPVPVAERSGSFPSVWGVAPDEEMRFFHRVRAVERDLLDAETASVLAWQSGRAPLSPSAASWSGLYGETAFFSDPDLPPPGREMEWLWRMQVFTQDHNGGGQDGALSTFQKRVRHERMQGYLREVIDHGVTAAADGEPIVLSTHLGPQNLVVLEPADVPMLEPHLPALPPSSFQRLVTADGKSTLALNLDIAGGVGTFPLRPVPGNGAPTIQSDPEAITITAGTLAVRVDRTSADVTVTGPSGTPQRWLGLMYAVRELGNDVTLATDEESRVAARVLEVSAGESGPLAAQVTIRLELLGVVWRLVLTVWGVRPALDLDVDVDWPALEDWQVRLPMAPDAPRTALRFGTPFHESAWEEMPPGAAPMQRDEVSPADQHAYREVQHWICADLDGDALAVLTQHPAFRSDGAETAAVLLRTAASCGDRRLYWTNPGRTTWRFRLQLMEGGESVFALADAYWRQARVLVGSSEPTELLENDGDPIRLSALFVDHDGWVSARLVNQSASPATVDLGGPLVPESAELVDLAGRSVGRCAAVAGRLKVTVPPWRIQTVRLVHSGRGGVDATDR